MAYSSRKLKPTKTQYSTFDRELMAIYLAVKHFGTYLRAVNSTFLWTISPWYTPCCHCIIDIPLDRFDTSTLYPNLHRIYVTSRGVCVNQVVDAVSQVQETSQVWGPAINFDQLAIAQRDDPDLSEASICSKFVRTKGHFFSRLWTLTNLGYVYWYHMPSSTSPVPMQYMYVWPSPLAFTPRHPGYTTITNNQIRLAGYQRSHLTMGPGRASGANNQKSIVIS